MELSGVQLQNRLMTIPEEREILVANGRSGLPPFLRMEQHPAFTTMDRPTTTKMERDCTSDNTSIDHGKWTDSPFSCLSTFFPNCFLSFCCCGILPLASMRQRMGFASYRRTYLEFFILLIFVVAVYCLDFIFWKSKELRFVYWFPLLIIPFWAYDLRSKVRRRFQLPGDSCDDCAKSFFCTCCSISQLSRQLKIYSRENFNLQFFLHGVPEIEEFV